MNQWLSKRALLLIAILGTITGSGVFLVANTGLNKNASVADDEVVKADEQAPKADKSSTVDQEAPKPLAEQKAGDVEKAADAPRTPSAPTKTDAAKGVEERRQLLETLGALTSAHCYQTYLNIGFIADAKAKGTYSERDAYKVLDSVLAVLNSVDRKLARLDKVELDKEDRASLDRMLQLSGLLRRQAKELQTFWDTGRDEDAAQYEKVRKDSWAALSSLMGPGR
jgi:hypothetical protein